MIGKMVRAARLDVTLYAEVEADKSATLRAMLVVILSSLAAGIGGLSTSGVEGLVYGSALALVGWGLWAYLNYMFGVKLLKEPQTEADWGQLLRTMGFANAPGVIRVLLIVPVWPFQLSIYALSTIWVLVAMVVAVRQALDYESTQRAIVVTVLGFLATGIILAFFLSLFTGGAPS